MIFIEVRCDKCGSVVKNRGKHALLEASDAKEQIGQHIGECPKHPMRIVEAERDAARAEVERLTKMLDVCAVTHDHNVKLKAEVERLKAHPVLQFIISEPGPGPEAGRFIEVEDGAGHSICAGQWTQLEDGNWSLTVPYPTGQEEHLKAEVERLKAELREAIKRGAWLQGELTATLEPVTSAAGRHNKLELVLRGPGMVKEVWSW